MKLTSRLLKSKGACFAQVDLFKALGGDDKKITKALVLKYANRFDWDWAAYHLLSAPAWDEYERARVQAWAEYKRARVPAWAEYERAQASALAEYKRVQASALAEYKRAQASAFWTQWKKEGNT